MLLSHFALSFFFFFFPKLVFVNVPSTLEGSNWIAHPNWSDERVPAALCRRAGTMCGSTSSKTVLRVGEMENLGYSGTTVPPNRRRKTRAEVKVLERTSSKT